MHNLDDDLHPVWSFAAAVLNSAKKPHPFERLEVVVTGPGKRPFLLDNDPWTEFDRSLAPNLCLKEFGTLMFRCSRTRNWWMV